VNLTEGLVSESQICEKPTTDSVAQREKIVETYRYVYINKFEHLENSIVQDEAVRNKSAFGYTNLGFPKNEVRTTKYTLLSFLPRNLAEQFRYDLVFV
jgi:hypothetical protein